MAAVDETAPKAKDGRLTGLTAGTVYEISTDDGIADAFFQNDCIAAVDFNGLAWQACKACVGCGFAHDVPGGRKSCEFAVCALAADNTYTITDVTEDKTVTVEGVEKTPVYYTVTFEGPGGRKSCEFAVCACGFGFPCFAVVS